MSKKAVKKSLASKYFRSLSLYIFHLELSVRNDSAKVLMLSEGPRNRIPLAFKA